MRPYADLIAEAEAADLTGWDFGWLTGRATEERPPWGYADLLARRLGTVGSALDLDTGGGEVVDRAPVLPPRMVVTEAWQPDVARERLGPRGVEVVESPRDLPDASFDLVSPRHPVDKAAAAERAGLEILDLRTARLRMEFLDVGAVVWTLRMCVWWVPGFTAGRFAAQLRELDARMRAGEPFVAHATRHLIEARRPAF